jgi:hypothetical protein
MCSWLSPNLFAVESTIGLDLGPGRGLLFCFGRSCTLMNHEDS